VARKNKEDERTGFLHLAAVPTRKKEDLVTAIREVMIDAATDSHRCQTVSGHYDRYVRGRLYLCFLFREVVNVDANRNG